MRKRAEWDYLDPDPSSTTYDVISGNHFSNFSGSMRLTFYIFNFIFRFHISDTMQYFSFSVFLISLSTMSSSSTHTVANGRMAFFSSG